MWYVFESVTNDTKREQPPSSPSSRGQSPTKVIKKTTVTTYKVPAPGSSPRTVVDIDRQSQAPAGSPTVGGSKDVMTTSTVIRAPIESPAAATKTASSAFTATNTEFPTPSKSPAPTNTAPSTVDTETQPPSNASSMVLCGFPTESFLSWQGASKLLQGSIVVDDDEEAQVTPSSLPKKLPSDGEIKMALRKLSKEIDLDDASLNEVVTLLGKEMGVDLFPKKSFIKELIQSGMPFPTDKEIQDATHELMPKLDMDNTSLTQFIGYLSVELGADVSSKKDLIKEAMATKPTIKKEASSKEEKKGSTDSVKESKWKSLVSSVKSTNSTTPDEKSVVEKPVTTMSSVEPESKKVSKASSQAQSTKTTTRTYTVAPPAAGVKAGIATAAAGVASVPPPVPVTQQIPTAKAVSQTRTTRTANTAAKQGQFRSEDLEQGSIIPAAAGMTWKDNFFRGEEDLVAVFDHDYDLMIWFAFRLAALRKLPWFIAIVIIGVLILFSAHPEYGVYIILAATALFALHQFGVWRIANSYFPALHVAVVRDGVMAVHDKHLEGSPLLASLFMDCFLGTSKKSETIPFDQITKVTIKDKGDSADMCCCYTCCCRGCIRIPYDSVGLDTGSSNPWCLAQCMSGLIKAKDLQKLIWAMKREKGEQIMVDMRHEMRFSNMMNFGASATQPRVNGVPVPNQVPPSM